MITSYTDHVTYCRILNDARFFLENITAVYGHCIVQRNAKYQITATIEKDFAINNET